jgi:hypothetical protein
MIWVYYGRLKVLYIYKFILGLSLYPNHPECLLLRSAIYRKTEKYNESLDDLNMASKHMEVDSKLIK